MIALSKINTQKIGKIIQSVKKLAIEYYKESGKPLGITGEVAEWEAAKFLGLKLCSARETGFDAIRTRKSGNERIQIKGRRILDTSKPGQRIGGIKLDKKWDSVVLVLLDEKYEATQIYEVKRPKIKKALLAPGSKARNERGALAISKFRSLAGKPLWSKK